MQWQPIDESEMHIYITARGNSQRDMEVWLNAHANHYDLISASISTDQITEYFAVMKLKQGGKE
jgi:hypothetical protein